MKTFELILKNKPGHPKWEYLLCFVLYWAVNTLCLTAIAKEYSTMPAYYSKDCHYKKDSDIVKGLKMVA